MLEHNSKFNHSRRKASQKKKKRKKAKFIAPTNDHSPGEIEPQQQEPCLLQ